MPRPKLVDDAAVLDATIQQIGSVGLARLTLAGVAAECGLSPATVVQRFKTKRGLLLAVAVRAADAADARRPPAPGDSPLTTLVDWLARLPGDPAPAELANHVAFLQLDLADAEFLTYARRTVLALRRDIRTLLDAAVARSELDAVDTDAVAGVVEAVYHGGMISWDVHGEGPLSVWLGDLLRALMTPRRGASAPGGPAT